MGISWNDKEPIYRQLHDRLVDMVLEGVVRDGDMLPSVRRISTENRINPITVSKALQLLVDEALVEKRRGLGMFLIEGASERLAAGERSRFMNEEWPEIVQKMNRLGISLSDIAPQEAS